MELVKNKTFLLADDHLIKILVTALVLVFSLALNIYFVAQPFHYIITHKTPDDAYYYLKIARNIVAGKGISFDAIKPTNGFHPLWLLLITPFMFLSQNMIRLVYVVLSLGVILNFASLLVFYKLLDVLKCNLFSFVTAFVLFAFSPFLVLANSGLETPLSILFITLTLLSLSKIMLAENEPKLKAYIWFGLIAGLTLLARLDNIFFILFCFVALGSVSIKRIHAVLFAGVIVTMLMLPYLTWNYMVFHSFMPVSGKAMPYVVHRNYLQQHGTLNGVYTHLWHQYINSAFAHVLDLFSLHKAWFYILVAGGMAAMLVRKSNKKAILLILAISTLVIFPAYHIFVRWMFRFYYAYDLLPIMLMAVALCLNELTSYLHNRLISILFALTIGFYILHGYFSQDIMKQYQFWPWAWANYQGTLWMNEHIPHRRVASFNAGINGYFYNGTLVNIDGVVNNAVLAAIKQGKLMTYLLKNNVAYIADFGLNGLTFATSMGDGYEKHLAPKWKMNPTPGQNSENLFTIEKIS